MLARSPDELEQLKPNERAALAEYLARLRAKYAARVRHVILYGSRARGEGDQESDLDVLVVVEDGDWRFHDEVALESCTPSIAHNTLISPLIWDREHFERKRRDRLLLYRNIEQDGIELWTVPERSR